ncbi:MAG TPA: L,D-transpeptidase family protein [Micromonosporaceae bacterium]|nr:L,D-transpeptidase family protein [Micromonosporaceae bacterium]
MRRTWLIGVLAAVTMATAACQTSRQAEPAPAPSPAVTATPTPRTPPTTPAPSPTTPAPPPATRTPSPKPVTPTPSTPARTGELRLGDSGPAVLALQQRLVALGYWLGAPDGYFGAATHHAVVAFQKAAGLGRDGVAGPVTRAALSRASRLRPRSAIGRVVEVDLRRQLLLVAVDGRVQWVMDTSTGSVPGSTPTGRYTVFRQVDGYDPGPLGVLYRPKYFVGGVAVHGYPSVPPYPASHGCVRVTNAAMDWLWANGALPVGRQVWVY